MNNKKGNISAETQQQALAVAKATQRPGQSKEQTKLIAQGIEKGIAEYKKLQKKKAREKDKVRKQELKRQQKETIEEKEQESHSPRAAFFTILPWALLAASWLGFMLYYAGIQ